MIGLSPLPATQIAQLYITRMKQCLGEIISLPLNLTLYLDGLKTFIISFEAFFIRQRQRQSDDADLDTLYSLSFVNGMDPEERSGLQAELITFANEHQAIIFEKMDDSFKVLI